jgi:hypothetical protein
VRAAPYTTKSGLQIGKYYQKVTRFWPSADMERLQTALLLRHEPLITPRKVVDGILWQLLS